MTTARDRVLARVRAALGRSAPLEPDRTGAMTGYVAQHASGPRPQPYADRVARFRERAVAMSCSVEEVETLAGVPDAIARYLRAGALPLSAVIWPELAAMDWRAAGIAAEARRAQGSDPVGISGAYCGLAETGTLVLLSGAEAPASVSLVPETHVAILACARIVDSMEDAWALVRAEHGELPRATNFVSGPSRTADIEQTLVLGAHGPARVHVVLVHEPRA